MRALTLLCHGLHIPPCGQRCWHPLHERSTVHQGITPQLQLEGQGGAARGRGALIRGERGAEGWGQEGGGARATPGSMENRAGIEEGCATLTALSCNNM